MRRSSWNLPNFKVSMTTWAARTRNGFGTTNAKTYKDYGTMTNRSCARASVLPWP